MKNKIFLLIVVLGMFMLVGGVGLVSSAQCNMTDGSGNNVINSTSISDGCTLDVAGLYTMSGETFYLNGSVDGAIIIGTSNIILNGGSSILIGNYTSNSLLNIQMIRINNGLSNVTLENLNIYNISRGFFVNNGGENITIKDSYVENSYHAIFCDECDNSSIENISTYSTRQAIFFEYGNNSIIKNCNLQNNTKEIIYVGYNNNLTIYNNTLNYSDVGIRLHNLNNYTNISNNNISNMYRNSDSYDVGIALNFNINHNTNIEYNNISKCGTVGIMLRHAINTTIKNNFFYSLTNYEKGLLLYDDLGEPSTAIGIYTWYKATSGNGSATDDDTFSDLENWKSNMTTIIDNTFVNYDLYLKNMHSYQLTEDLITNGAKYKKHDSPYELYRDIEYYLNPSFNTLYEWDDGINSSILYWRTNKRYMLNFILNKNYEYWENINDTNYIIGQHNITNALISFDNGTTISVAGTNQAINLTLIPNQYVYVYTDTICNNTVCVRDLNSTWENDANLTITSGDDVTKWYQWIINGVKILVGTGQYVLRYIFDDSFRGTPYNVTLITNSSLSDYLTTEYWITSDSGANITLNSPSNNAIYNTSLITFNASVSLINENTLANTTLYDNSTGVFLAVETNNGTFLYDGLISYYSFEDSPNDSTGLYNGTATSLSYNSTAGKQGNGVIFNSGSDLMNVSDIHYNWSGINWSISLWANQNATQQGGFFSTRINKTVGGGYITLGTYTGYLQVETDDGTILNSSIFINDSAWRYYSLTYNEITNNLSLYINGVLNTSTTSEIKFGNQSNSVFLGTWGADLTTQSFLGFMDEFGMWNKTLTQDEITTIYNSGTGLNYSDIFTTGNGILSSGETFTKNYTSAGNYRWNVYACDNSSDCGFADSNNTFTILLLENKEGYISNTTSGATNLFYLDFDTDSIPITLASLYYNNTLYTGSINNTGSSYNVSINREAPGVVTATNISFYWYITLANGMTYNTTTHNQTVNPLGISTGCTGNYSIYNFTLVDEITQQTLDKANNDTLIKIDLYLYNLARTSLLTHFYAEYSETIPATVCMNNNLSNGQIYSVDLQVEYSATNYSKEFYNIELDVLNSSTINRNITLYDLDTTNAQEFKIIARDSSYIPIGGALIKIDRKYVQNGTFHTSEIPKTNDRGTTSASLQTEDVIYNFYVYENGTLSSSFLNVFAICQTPLVTECLIELSETQEGVNVTNYTKEDDFTFNIAYNSTSRVVSSTYTIPSGTPGTVTLNVTKEDSLGTSVCSDSITSAGGTLTCIVPSNFGNATITAKLYKAGVEIGKGQVKLDQKPSDIFGGILIILSVIVLMTLIGIAITDNPIITLILLFVGVILIYSINLAENSGFIGATATILFLAIAIILVIIKAGRRS